MSQNSKLSCHSQLNHLRWIAINLDLNLFKWHQMECVGGGPVFRAECVKTWKEASAHSLPTPRLGHGALTAGPQLLAYHCFFRLFQVFRGSHVSRAQPALGALHTPSPASCLLCCFQASPGILQQEPKTGSPLGKLLRESLSRKKRRVFLPSEF